MSPESQTIRIQEILDLMPPDTSPEDKELVRKSYVFAAAAHAGQTRLSGEPYLSHPLAVAHTLAEMRMDAATLAAGILHDTVEDTKASLEQLKGSFGQEVADIVDGVTKISLMSFDTKEAQQAENFRKMILAMNEDMRVLFVKLSDRLHNMRTMGFQRPDKQRRIAQETMDIYAPLANRLGLHRIKLELEDLSFRYIAPEPYQHIHNWLEQNQADDSKYIDEVVGILEKALKKNKIPARIKGRIKHIYSIYRKMHANNLDLDQMHDIIAFRVIVEDLKDCYAALGLVHATWKPVPGRFKDYISVPKNNMYQSLHTTVIGPGGERMEVQIRSEDMDRLAENGLAAHWLYKEGGAVTEKDMRQFAWLREILDWQKMESDPKEFLRSLRIDLFKDEIYVFTPKGAVKELPEKATPVDFAYLIHTEVGNHCAGAKVNGKLVPLSTPLKNGDMVEIITDSHRTPSRDWLKFVKTAKARTRINHYVRTEERGRSIAFGREVLEKQGRRLGLNIQKLHKDGDLAIVAAELSLNSVDDLYSQVGYSHITPRKVLNLLLPQKPEDIQKQQQQQQEAQAAAKTEQNKAVDSVGIKGVDGVLMRFAKCCNPVPGDAIIGYISRGRGVTVHTLDCPTVQSVEPERLLSVFWEGGETESAPFPARIRVSCTNTPGALAGVATLLSKEGINIDSGQFRSAVDGRSELELLVEVKDVAQLYFAMDKIRKLSDVMEVARMTVGATN